MIEVQIRYPLLHHIPVCTSVKAGCHLQLFFKFRLLRAKAALFEIFDLIRYRHG